MPEAKATSETQPQPGASSVSYEGASKRYGSSGALAVDRLTLEVPAGEICVLVGPSGCGKTTAMRMVNRTVEMTAGDILVGGESVRDKDPAQLRREIGYVIQQIGLFPHRTIAENIGAVPQLLGWKKDRTRARTTELLELIGLDPELGERYPAQLSGGQQQRVALARALVFEPQLVLMDEPLGALDKQLREHMQIELKELHRQLGVTFVYVTHDQSEALTMSDRVAVFNDGAIQQIDVVDRMYETPANRFVAGFIGDSTMLHGTVRASDGERCGIVLTDGRVLTGINVNGAAVGAKVQAGIRPERIVLHAQAPGEHGNVLQARVASVIYFGDHLRLLCSVGEGQSDSTVKLPLSAPAVPAVGDSVWLEFPPDLTRVYA